MLNKQKRQIVRISGKSQEVRLEEYSLFNLKKHGDRAQGREEKRHLFDIYAMLEHLRTTIQDAAKTLLKERLSWDDVTHLIERIFRPVAYSHSCRSRCSCREARRAQVYW